MHGAPVESVRGTPSGAMKSVPGLANPVQDGGEPSAQTAAAVVDFHYGS